MKRATIWVLITGLIVISLILASCSSSTTTAVSASTSTAATTTTTSVTLPTTSISTSPITTPSTVTATTTSTGNWWDSLGMPKYGGTLTLETPTDISTFDPYTGNAGNQVFDAYMELLIGESWTMDPSIQPFHLAFFDNSQAEGDLLKSWEFTGSGIFVLNVRQGIYYQNLAPSYGREFTATDIVDHFDRILGLGNGYTKPGPYFATDANWLNLQSITATDNFTVTMQWNTSNIEFIYEVVETPGTEETIEDPDAVAAYGNLNNWHNAIGTGPFMLTDFVDGTSATLQANPNYWGYDERYPQNKLPYINGINMLIITSQPTALAAMRAGKITAMDGVSAQDATNMQKTNPSILQMSIPQANCNTIDMRNDKAPYNNLQVREALQMAINLPQIAQTYYNGKSESNPESLTSDFMPGWGLPYSQWPADLQAQYAYNPTQAKQLLASAGFPSGFNTDMVVNAAADMGLVQIVQSYFSAIGVNMTLQVMDATSFNTYVNVNHQYDALTIRQPGAGDLGLTYYPIRQLSRFSTGFAANVSLVNDPNFNIFATQGLAATSTSQVKTILTAANLYTDQQHFVISLLQPYQFALYQPFFKGFNDQFNSISGGSGAPLLGEYGARFWIDQNR